MPKNIAIMIIGILFAMVMTQPLQAAVPHLVRYQGYATDAQGVALDGQYNLTFRVYDAPTGGNKLWEELQNNVPVAKGNFSVLLGQVTALNLNFDKDCWISVQVNTDTEMTPRQRITTVPTAIRAERMDGSENVSGVNFAKNSSFDSWSNGASAAPDIWALTGTGATIARNTVKKFGTYSASVTAAGADAVLTQTISNYQDYANVVVTLAVWVKTSTANSARIFISDGTPTYSSYHTGTGAWELLTVTKSLTAAPASLSIGISVTAGKIVLADGVMFTRGLQTWAYNELIEAPAGAEKGDILYYDNGWKRLAKGNENDVLKISSGLPIWVTPIIYFIDNSTKDFNDDNNWIDVGTLNKTVHLNGCIQVAASFSVQTDRVSAAARVVNGSTVLWESEMLNSCTDPRNCIYMNYNAAGFVGPISGQQIFKLQIKGRGSIKDIKFAAIEF